MSNVTVVNSLGEILGTAIRVLIKCEVRECMEYTHEYYTTCKTHTELINRVDYTLLKYVRQPVWHYNSTVPEADTVFDFRFSASYASRYNNCHGSANLDKAIPGFIHPERNDNGMKGEGTKLHKIFEMIILSGADLTLAAKLLKEFAAVRGPKRADLLLNEKMYITWWFLQFKSLPPVEHSVLVEGLLLQSPIVNVDGSPTLDKDGVPMIRSTAGTPRRIVHVGDALEYVRDLIDMMDPDTLFIKTEAMAKVMWLQTQPNTTVDLVIGDWEELHVLDLKMGDLAVSPIDNEQLMYYGETFREIPGGDGDRYQKITLHIMQRGATDSWQVPVPVLDKWVDTVKASEAAIMDGDLTLSPGKHCTFCPANPHGRGDRGNKACPAMMFVLYGQRDEAQADQDALGEDFGDDE